MGESLDILGLLESVCTWVKPEHEICCFTFVAYQFVVKRILFLGRCILRCVN
jgi:hypothetical protein